MPEFFMGLDLGKASDYTAIAVLEEVQLPTGKVMLDKRGETIGPEMVRRYYLRHLERLRLGTSYPAIVARVKDLLSKSPLKGAAILIVDATGVGAPVVDMLRGADVGASIVPVTITGGSAVSRDPAQGYGVPKRDLVSNLQVLFQSGRLKIADKLPEAQILVKELLGFQVKISLDAHDSYGAWREGTHDDLVLSVALAAWYAQTVGRVMPFGWMKDPRGEVRR